MAEDNVQGGFPAFVLVNPDFIPHQDRLSYDLFILTRDTNRLLLYRRSGLPFGKNEADELSGMNAQVYISETEWKHVLNLKGESLAGLVQGRGTSEKIGTEAGSTVAHLSGANSWETLSKAMFDCASVVEKTVDSFEGTELSTTFKQLNTILIQREEPFLMHARNVSTMAVLFGLTVGLTDKQQIVDLGIMGFLHDVGFATLGQDVHEAYLFGSTEDREGIADQNPEYELHPEKSVELAEARGIPLSMQARQGILEHHENYDGTGFPYNLAGKEISSLGRILTIADGFVGELFKGGEETMDPATAFATLISRNMNSEKMKYDPNLLEVIWGNSFGKNESRKTTKKAA